MTTADYALIVSIGSAGISLVALLWNVWQKYIFVRPSLQVSFGVFRVFHPAGLGQPVVPGEQLLSMGVTNVGPGPAVIHSCVGRSRRQLWRFRYRLGVLNPIHGNPLSPTPTTIGPFSGGLPAKIDAAEIKSFYFPLSQECFLRERLVQVGVHDTYGRYFWCRRRDYRKAVRDWNEKFGLKQRATWSEDDAASDPGR
jgi:hypothetical protein